MIDKNRIIKELSLKPFGGKGWMRSNEMICSNCGQNDEFAVLFTKDSGIVRCLHGKSCGNYTTSLYNYLKEVERLDLIGYKQTVNLAAFPDFSESEEAKIEEVALPVKRLPIGFKRLNFDEYLNSRGFLTEHYELFGVGKSRIDPRCKGDLVFQFKNKENECIAWMSRSKHDKEWHDENLKNFKAGIGELRLRYNNSYNTDFSKILGGENEITSKTNTIIIVEGIMDKINVDRQLGLLFQEEMKCCFTFGNAVGPEQIQILKKYKNIKVIYLMYDEGTIRQSKHCGLLLDELEKSVFVAEIKEVGLDPGDMSKNQIMDSLQQSVNSFSFNLNKVDGITY